MDNVVHLPQQEDKIWVCGCGCVTHYLHVNGDAECANCGEVCPEGEFRTGKELNLPSDQPITVMREYNDPSGEAFTIARMKREMDSADLLGVALFFGSGRVNCFANKAETEEGRQWWRGQIEILKKQVGLDDES